MQEAGVPDGSGVLQINGSPTDAAAGLIRDGVDRVLEEVCDVDSHRRRLEHVLVSG